jgi:Zn-dependent protease
MFNPSLPELMAKLIILFVGFPIHEFSHAYVAYRLGDNTAQQQGRLSLNPLRHLDPWGSILLLVAGFGWAKPVPVSPYQLRYGPRVGGAMVSAAGPLSNLALTVPAALAYRVAEEANLSPVLKDFLEYFVVINALLFVFNLIPLSPLDGFRVLAGIIGESAYRALAPLQAYGPVILMVLFALGWISPRMDFLGRGIQAVTGAISSLLLGT